MASNTTLNTGTGGDIIVSKERSHDGDTAKQQGVFVSSASGTEGSYTWTDLQVSQVDVAAGASDTGIAPLAVRDDALATLTPVDGDYTHLRVDSTGALWVNVSNAEGTATDDAAYTAASGTGVPIMGFATSDVVDAGDVGAVAMSTDRRLHVDAQIVGQDAAVTVDGSGVTQPVSAASLPLPSGAATAANQSSANALLTTIDADTSTLAGAVAGSEMQVDVVGSLPAGTNNIGDVDVLTIAAGSNLIGDVGISGARTSGGTTLYRNVDVDETEDSVKASGGQLYWIHAMNLTAAVLYLQFYNATVASVTVGTTTPDLTFALPTTGDTNGAGFTLAIPNGIAFSTAITIACTTTIGGAAGPAANGVIVNLGYA